MAELEHYKAISKPISACEDKAVRMGNPTTGMAALQPEMQMRSTRLRVAARSRRALRVGFKNRRLQIQLVRAVVLQVEPLRNARRETKRARTDVVSNPSIGRTMLNPPGSASAQWLSYALCVKEFLYCVFRFADSTWARDFLVHPNGAQPTELAVEGGW